MEIDNKIFWCYPESLLCFISDQDIVENAIGFLVLSLLPIPDSLGVLDSRLPTIHN
ncbi:MULTISPECIES: hypothetical protein [Moorena]|uniref:hypothetical protein n=1 Tax=Moorena TaxID=1155738 RepID=UPI0012B673EB|nr:MULTISPECIES: hypothetical protein [Moorena]NEP37462.1 hypothetical protein [Moorena sp. SIO3B2]NEP64687.1 hypothetical protein [Moorena sp. SIO3A5]NEQ09154.1 hypothetical protein [Moorena sp. SIO4E2]NER85843.1 hypothetical protein [Moorena sp. SIO3A2]NES43950.1 hypothetical protein [Moorena sp. SIO2C4]